MTNPRYKSHTLGVELTTTSGTRFSLGVSDLSSMIEGKVTLMSATGRDAGDTVQYDEKRCQRSHSLNSSKNMSFFMSASIPLEQTRTRSLSLAATQQSGFDLKKAPPQIGVNMSYSFCDPPLLRSSVVNVSTKCCCQPPARMYNACGNDIGNRAEVPHPWGSSRLGSRPHQVHQNANLERRPENMNRRDSHEA